MNRKKEVIKIKEIEEKKQEQVDLGPESVEHLLLVDPLELEVGYGLVPLVDNEQGGGILDKVRYLRRQFATDFGIVIPTIHVRDNMHELGPSEYQILLKGVRIAGDELMVNHDLAIDPGDVTRKIEGIETREPAFGLPAVWIPEAGAEEARLAGYTVVDNLNIMVTHLVEVLRKHAPELLGRQEVQNLLDNLSKSYPKVVEELVPNLLSLGNVQTVLRNLLQEQVPIKDMLTIVETLADYAPMTKDTDMLTEFVRHKLARSIISPHMGEDGILMVITMGQNAEDILIKDYQKTEHGSLLPADPRVVDRLVTSIREEVEKAEA